MKKLLIVLATALSLSACAHRAKPIVDTAGVDLNQYYADLSACQAYAEEVPKGGALKGAAGGAVVGGLVGAAVGNSTTAKKAAGVGAVTGAVRGGLRSKAEQSRVVKNCLSQRGYRVLN